MRVVASRDLLFIKSGLFANILLMQGWQKPMTTLLWNGDYKVSWTFARGFAWSQTLRDACFELKLFSNLDIERESSGEIEGLL